MVKAPETLAGRINRLFWAAWAKIWWLIGLSFVAANYWGLRRFGAAALIRGWGVAFLVIAVSGLFYVWRRMKLAQESEGWLPVEARIVSSSVLAEEEGGVDSTRGPGPIIFWYPQVTYEYEVHGLIYESSRILFVDVNYPKSEAESLVARYPAGSRTTAFVNPENPRQAILETGLRTSRGKYYKAGMVCLGLAAAGGLMWLMPRLLGLR
jgi:hypothetical protein